MGDSRINDVQLVGESKSTGERDEKGQKSHESPEPRCLICQRFGGVDGARFPEQIGSQYSHS
ncbi:hypothetical protein PC116_g28467 [Phytophthora cactorum]|nr:hypothetical protein PC116_g28467 [Phytophthora cactorum]